MEKAVFLQPQGSQVQVLKGAQFLCFMLLIFWPRRFSPILRGFFYFSPRCMASMLRIALMRLEGMMFLNGYSIVTAHFIHPL